MTRQAGILPGIPNHGRYLELRKLPGADVAAALRGLRPDAALVVGLGPALVAGFADVDGLHGFRAVSAAGVDIPSTQADLWLWLRGADRGKIAKQARTLLRQLAGFEVVRVVDGFKYGIEREAGMDLSGYEDGTENPQGDAALAAAFAADGSSFVSVQQWEHDLGRFDAMPQLERDHIIGRREADNVELEDAPEFAHVKRTAQESFSPEAFILRRSMPFAEAGREGLVFVAFGHSFDAFEAQLNRMAGLEDGIADGLFRFSHPVTGGNYWCPPVKDGALDLSQIGL